jgi:hypothetical protein
MVMMMKIMVRISVLVLLQQRHRKWLVVVNEENPMAVWSRRMSRCQLLLIPKGMMQQQLLRRLFLLHIRLLVCDLEELVVWMMMLRRRRRTWKWELLLQQLQLQLLIAALRMELEQEASPWWILLTFMA